MEIRQFDNAVGTLAAQDLVEGRLVILTVGGDGGNANRVARLPIDATEARDARWVITWPQLNIPFPGPLTSPALDFSLRTGGFDQTQTQPYSQTVHLTNPSVTDARTIPSGFQAVAHGGENGVYTVGSGLFIAGSARLTELVPGNRLEVLNVGDDTTDAGKLNYTVTDADAVAFVVEYDVANEELTFDMRGK